MTGAYLVCRIVRVCLLCVGLVSGVDWVSTDECRVSRSGSGCLLDSVVGSGYATPPLRFRERLMKGAVAGTAGNRYRPGAALPAVWDVPAVGG